MILCLSLKCHLLQHLAYSDITGQNLVLNALITTEFYSKIKKWPHYIHTKRYPDVFVFLLPSRKATFPAMAPALTSERQSEKPSTSLSAQGKLTRGPQLKMLLAMGLWCACAQYPFCIIDILWLPWSWAKTPQGSPMGQRQHWMPASNLSLQPSQTHSTQSLNTMWKLDVKFGEREKGSLWIFSLSLSKGYIKLKTLLSNKWIRICNS